MVNIVVHKESTEVMHKNSHKKVNAINNPVSSFSRNARHWWGKADSHIYSVYISVQAADYLWSNCKTSWSSLILTACACPSLFENFANRDGSRKTKTFVDSKKCKISVSKQKTCYTSNNTFLFVCIQVSQIADNWDRPTLTWKHKVGQKMVYSFFLFPAFPWANCPNNLVLRLLLNKRK